jgi:hypothetical protein
MDQTAADRRSRLVRMIFDYRLAQCGYSAEAVAFPVFVFVEKLSQWGR